LRGTLVRICNLLTRRKPGTEIAVADQIDGKAAAKAPPSTIHLGANGLDATAGHHDDDDDEALTGSAGNGANPNQPHSNRPASRPCPHFRTAPGAVRPAPGPGRATRCSNA